jgi:hypothetical protein
MDKKELAKKLPMAAPGFTTITPKSEPDRQSEPDGQPKPDGQSEPDGQSKPGGQPKSNEQVATEYDKKILAEQEKQMMDCCDGYSPYDRYGYKPRPKNPSEDSPTDSEPTLEPQNVSQTEKKNKK